jgi:hypothetical protein
MLNEVHPPSVEEAPERIESALQAELDQGRYREWRILPLDTRRQVADAVVSALTKLDEEKTEQARRKLRAKARKWYWKERKRIHGQLERIAGSPEVSILAKITLRDFEECLCSHGWNWTYCESLGQRLVSLREATPDASDMPPIIWARGNVRVQWMTTAARATHAYTPPGCDSSNGCAGVPQYIAGGRWQAPPVFRSQSGRRAYSHTHPVGCR